MRKGQGPCCNTIIVFSTVKQRLNGAVKVRQLLVSQRLRWWFRIKIGCHSMKGGRDTTGEKQVGWSENEK
jgi:hypothetical protein